MFNNPLMRIVIGIPAAAFITYLLYVFMLTAITQDELQLDERPERTLEAITPQEDPTEVRTRSRDRAKRLDSANKPPPPPKLSTTKSDIDLPTPSIQGAAPTELKFDRMQSLAIDPVAISDRDAQPIRPPQPSFPSRAAERGIEGSCDVRFDVDTRGRPYNITASCTDSIFKREAERAVSKVEFAPKIIRGQPAERKNVVYPIEFKLG